MEFRVSRTSLFGTGKPCDGARLEDRSYWETRTCTEEQFNKWYSEREGFWRSKGSDHRIDKDGFICRKMGPVKTWVIDIRDIKQLLSFADENDLVVSSLNEGPGKAYGIEIYDDYRE